MQKAIIYLFYKIGTNFRFRLLVALALLFIFLLIRSSSLLDRAYYKMAATPEDRGAATVTADTFGDKFTQVKYLNQNWSPADSLWFYTTTQGSDLLPYDFFLHLENAKSTEPFRSPENMNRYRYLPQTATTANPDALPVGMVADEYRGKKYMGFTCAACHTTQVNYNNVGLRIDGGPGRGFAAPAVVAEVPKTEWPAPLKGDALVCTDGNFLVDYVGVDEGGLVWRLDLKKVA